jgi:hypothetical protein
MIRFRCDCGKSLKAPEKLAGKTSRCPACIAVVVVPQLALVFAGHGSDEDRPPEETFAIAAPSTWVPSPQEQGDPNYVPTMIRTRGSGARPDPLTGVKFVVYLSGMLGLLTALGTALYPHVLHEGISWVSGLVLAVVWAAATGVLVGYGCNYLDSVLEYAVSGGEKFIYVPSRDSVPAIQSCLRWTLSFVSGPALLFYLALRYWIHCGDVTLVDGLILAELTVPAIGYWLMELLVLAERTELAYASPWQVLFAIRRLGRRSLLAAFGTSAAAFVYVCVGVYAVMLLHSAWLMGLVLLWLCWYSAWECGAFALRIAGFWYYGSGCLLRNKARSTRFSVQSGERGGGHHRG